jgi:hypothetical protein
LIGFIRATETLRKNSKEHNDIGIDENSLKIAIQIQYKKDSKKINDRSAKTSASQG